jgi:hypothetical protein
MTLHSRSKAGLYRKTHKPSPETAKQVLTMTGYGIRQEDIATVLDIHPKTLRVHYRRELDTGATEANVRVVQALFKNAVTNQSVQAQVWWTKARMGWREAQEVALTGNTPIMVITGVTRELPAPKFNSIKDADWEDAS